MPALPDPHGIATLVLTVVALLLFTRDKIPLETSALFILAAIILMFQIFPYESDGEIVKVTTFFRFFGHEALITVCALMILGKSIEMTGALHSLANFVSRGWRASPYLTLLAVLLLSAVLSAFLNNTPIVVMMLPVLVGVALRTKKPASKLLIPMGLATVIGGMATTIGTSTNLLVVGLAEDLGQEPMSMFFFTKPVLIAGSLGILYLWLVAPRMLPVRNLPLSDTAPRVFNALLYVKEDSFAHNRSLRAVLAKTDNRMAVERILRGKGLLVAKLPSVKLQAGDRLLVADTKDNLKDFERALGTTLFSSENEDSPVTDENPLRAEDQKLAEVVVTRGSFLHHRTLRSTRFSNRYGLKPLAIHRAKTQAVDTGRGLSDIFLRSGDVLLLQGKQKALTELRRSGDLLVLDGTTDLPTSSRSPVAFSIMAGVVACAAFGWLPISVSALMGLLLMLITRCLNWQSAVSALSIPVVLVIVASLALGESMMRTGGAEYVAQLFIVATQGMPIPVIISALMFFMAVLTNVVSNNAAAVIGTPIAISVAAGLDASATPFILAVIFGTNMSFATPVGYQTNLLIFSAGGYRFADFVKVGVPLTIIMWISFSFLIPWLYPLNG